MEEKILVKSERYNTIAVSLMTMIVFILIGVLIVNLIYTPQYEFEREFEIIDEIKEYIRNGGDEDLDNRSSRHPRWHYGAQDFSTPIKDVLKAWRLDVFKELFPFYACGIAPGLLIGLVVYWWLSKIELTVTDKRVYGKTVFGRRVDLPVDSVSAIGSRAPKGIAVATSSGKIAFLMIKNCDQIHKCVSELLIQRQEKPVETTTIKQEIPQSNADELKKYKDLLDSGIITQEEFDAKKKQLLGL